MKNKKEENEFGKHIQDFKTDYDLLKENFKFIWEEDEEPASENQKFAKEFYEKLFKEYCIADLSQYKFGK
jgi:protein FRA10AC1